MLIPADPLDADALAAALAPGQRRHQRSRVEVDWDRDGSYGHALSDISAACSRVGVQWERADSSPGSSRFQAGVSSRALTVTLNGAMVIDGRQRLATELFSPYNWESPFYGLAISGTPIRWSVETSTARGWLSTRQFSGTIDERSVARGGVVTLTCLDVPPTLRNPASWPPWAVDGPAAARIGTFEPQRGLASSLVDHIFNQAGLRTRPRPPWESHPADAIALCWLPLTGSFAPSVGKQISQHPWGNFQYFPAVYPISPATEPSGIYWVDGPFGLARHGAPGIDPGSAIYTTRDSQPVWAGRSTSVTAWIWCGPEATGYDPSPGGTLRPQVAATYFGYGTGSGNFYAIRLSVASSGPTVQIQVETGTNRHYYATYVPLTTGWRHVHAELDHTSGPVTARLIVDGVQQASFTPTGTGNSVAATALLNLWLPQVGFHLRAGVDMSDAMSWQEAGPPTIVPERTFTPGAVVDRSLNEITHVPRPGESAWSDLRQLTAGEMASVTVTEVGLVWWRNRETAAASGGDPQEITLAHAAEISASESEDGYATSVLVSAQPGQASWQNAWSAPAVDTVVARRGVTEWIFPLADNVIAVESGTVPRLYQSTQQDTGPPAWSASNNHGYVFVYDGTETEELSNANMVGTTNQAGLGDGQLMRLVITNTGASPGRFRLKQDADAGTDPQPALRIAGLVLARGEQEQTTVTWPAAQAADGGRVRTLNLAGGEWAHHLGSMERLAWWVLRRATQRIPTFGALRVLGDPRREVDDRVVLLLGDTGQRIRGFLASVGRTWENGQLIDQVIVRASHAPARWALGDPVLGVLGDTAVLG